MRLEQLCAAQGLTLEQLAKRSGVRPAVVARIATGTVSVKLTTMRRLAEALTMEPWQLRNELPYARTRRWRPWRTREAAGNAGAVLPGRRR